jgi:hypothetical protein
MDPLHTCTYPPPPQPTTQHHRDSELGSSGKDVYGSTLASTGSYGRSSEYLLTLQVLQSRELTGVSYWSSVRVTATILVDSPFCTYRILQSTMANKHLDKVFARTLAGHENYIDGEPPRRKRPRVEKEDITQATKDHIQRILEAEEI